MENGKTVPTPWGLRDVGERGSQLGVDESYWNPAFPSASMSSRPCWSNGDLNPRTSFFERDSSRDLHRATLSTLFSKLSKISRPSCFVSCPPTSPAVAREISNCDERGYRSLGTFQVERTPSLDSMSARRPAPSSRPSFVSTSWVIARACDFPFLQKAMRGTAHSAATTRLARNIARRHSTGASLSSVRSATELGALKARFLMKEGIARYENGIFVTRRNFLLGTSSSPPATSLSYSETRSTDDR